MGNHIIEEKLDSGDFEISADGVISIVKPSRRTWQNSQSFTPGTSRLINLPVGTTLGDFDFIEVTWHTGTGTASDNIDRDFTELGSMSAILSNPRASIILNGRGRGDANYGIEADTSGIAPTDIFIVLSLINLDDTGGAMLPSGSLITNVRFY